MNSREWKKARPPLLKAASKAKHGKLYAQLGQSYIQDEDWKNAEKYLVKAVEKGKLEKRESNTYLVLGITQARLGKFEKAIKMKFSRPQPPPSFFQRPPSKNH